MNLANIVSLFRLFSTVIIVLWINEHRFFEALILFSLAALSDLLDGFLARTFKNVSRFGAHLDPIADKVLLMGVFIALTYQEKIPFWLTGLVVARDCQIILGVLFLHLIKQPFTMTPLFISKVNTVLQMMLVLVCLTDPSTQNLFYSPVLYGTTISTLLSSICYIPLWWKNLFYLPVGIEKKEKK